MNNNLRDNIRKVLANYEIQQVKGKTVEQIYRDCIQFVISNIKISANNASCHVLKEGIKEKLDLDVILQIENQERKMTVEDILLLCNCYHFSTNENILNIVFWYEMGTEFIKEFNEEYDFIVNVEIPGKKINYAIKK